MKRLYKIAPLCAMTALSLVLGVRGAYAIAIAPETGFSGYLNAIGNNVQGPKPIFSDVSTIPFSDNVSETKGSGTGQASISIIDENGNVGLHGSANAISGPAQSAGEFDIFYFDTFSIFGTGLQTFRVTLTLDGSASVTGDPSYNEAFGILQLIVNGAYLGPGQVSSGDGGVGTATLSSGTVTGGFTAEAGQSIELDLFLLARTVAVFDGGTANYDVSDTGFFTLTDETAGGGFTAASDLTYSSDPDVAAVPEPGSLTLLVSSLLGFGAVGCWRRRLNRSLPTTDIVFP